MAINLHTQKSGAVPSKFCFYRLALSEKFHSLAFGVEKDCDCWLLPF